MRTLMVMSLLACFLALAAVEGLGLADGAGCRILPLKVT